MIGDPRKELNEAHGPQEHGFRNGPALNFEPCIRCPASQQHGRTWPALFYAVALRSFRKCLSTGKIKNAWLAGSAAKGAEPASNYGPCAVDFSWPGNEKEALVILFPQTICTITAHYKFVR